MKNVKKPITAAIILLGLLFACAEADNQSESWTEETGMTAGATAQEIEYEDMANNNRAGEQTDVAELDEPENLTVERKLIKNGHITFETDSLANRKAIIDKAVKDFDAYIEQENQYTNYNREDVVLTIRVPAVNFDAFLEAVSAGVGTFDDKSIGVDDVTEEYVDVAARIETKKELKLRYIKLLDKAESIKSIMEIEREINTIQAEIESYEGRLKYLSGSIKYATITVNYYRMLDVPTHFDNKFENAFSTGWQGFVWFFVALVSIWPFLIILSVVWLIIRYRIRKRKMKKASA